jgi:hypothetical protein
MKVGLRFLERRDLSLLVEGAVLEYAHREYRWLTQTLVRKDVTLAKIRNKYRFTFLSFYVPWNY